MALDVFDNDDCVIDHDANGEHQAEQREHIQREAEECHRGERADEGDGNCHQRN
jgi:hypothetical protein